MVTRADLEEVIQHFYMDLSAALLAVANALEKKGVLTKSEIAEAAQERLLTLREGLPEGIADSLVLLRALATQFEKVKNDLSIRPAPPHDAS